MDEARPDGGSREAVQEPVEGIVADEGPGGVADLSGEGSGGDGLGHGGHRDGGKNAVGGTGEDGRFYGLITPVVGDPGGGHIDGDPLRGHRIPSARLSNAQDHIGRIRRSSGQDGLGGEGENRGDLQLRQPIIADGIRQTPHRLPGGIDGLAAEGVKAGDDEVFHC